ncbi:MAG: nucleotidyltransferase domain-containing protein [Roseivirga sp.]|uniref:nucleotidyltransferase domain-containing protein n=1 Tax=Roseivirga sp. TaxID=1964215 RepID=UPI001B22E0E5|nr:nucleotidyltransferase domain-containing protein [Roseivirga sp.]MBO6659578.1 nucleotidyltransferase domain-containing protein [Roseivirga sp.]MBO6907685.1 nucleotidyltransferase domain-containing protein [Roseivirga sp.]
MKFGLEEKVIDTVNECLSNYLEIEEVIIYGSRAKGNYRNGSDIDLTLKGDSLTLSTILKLENEIDDLLLPYKFDLSIYHQIDNQDLIDHIERVGKIFYTK